MTEQEGEYGRVLISEINIPDLRVSAQFDEELREEFVESVARQGVLVPVLLHRVGGKLWLIDGRNRIMAARAVGLTEVPARVMPGTTAGLMLLNLATSRQKGRSNPAEEAQLIRRLREDEGMPLEQIAQSTGLSVRQVRKLHDIATLTPSVLELLGQGKLGISHCEELLALEDPDRQRETAQQAVEWRYTVEQVRARVHALLDPSSQPGPGGVQFDNRGVPARVPIPCYVCHVDLTGGVNYIYICGACQALINEFLIEYQRTAVAPAAPETSAAAHGAVGADTGQAQGA